MRNRAILSVAALAIVATIFTGCVKLQNRVILKGNWELVNYKLDTINRNYMEVVLPSYDNPPGCCKYMIDFQDNDKCVGTYYVNDTVNYTVEGTWSLDEKNELFIDLDKYVNGTFHIDRQNRKDYVLETDQNTIEIDASLTIVFPTRLDIKRRFD